MKIYTLDEVKDKLIGQVGTPRRDAYEIELKLDLIGDNQRHQKKTQTHPSPTRRLNRRAKSTDF